MDMLGYTKNNPFFFSLDTAKQLLKKANLEHGFSIKLDTVRLDIAQILKDSFAKVNIKLDIIPSDNKQILTKYRAHSHDLFIGAWGTDYPDPHANASAFAYNTDNSDKAANKTLAWRNTWKDDNINQKTILALNTLHPQKRKKLYEEIQLEMQKKSPFIFMFQLVDAFIMQKNVKNMTVGPFLDSTNYYYAYKE